MNMAVPQSQHANGARSQGRSCSKQLLSASTYFQMHMTWLLWTRSWNLLSPCGSWYFHLGFRPYLWSQSLTEAKKPGASSPFERKTKVSSNKVSTG